MAGPPLAAAARIVFEFIELHPFSAFQVRFADQAHTCDPTAARHNGTICTHPTGCPTRGDGDK